MKDLSPSDLKAILHSKRANLFYLERCRVMQKDGRVLYRAEDAESNAYYNIPIANTTVILLGTGTSITQAAVRMLCQAGVLVGFCGGGATPLYMGNDIEWMTPQNEYRPTEYLQGWLGFWFNAERRLAAGRAIQQARISFLRDVWQRDRDLKNEGFDLAASSMQAALNDFTSRVEQAKKPSDLLMAEAKFAKYLYQYSARITDIGEFKRDHNSTDLANGFLNHGNYLAYGLAACCLWVLGIPHGFAVMHGKTRRGALVFDVADLVKDTLILPWAFISAKEKATEQEFRQQILQVFTQHKALNFMFEQVKSIALQDTPAKDREGQEL